MGWIGLLARCTGSRRYWDSEERWRRRRAIEKANEHGKEEKRYSEVRPPPQEAGEFYQQPNPDYYADAPAAPQEHRARSSRTAPLGGRSLPSARSASSHPRSAGSHLHIASSHSRSTSRHSRPAHSHSQSASGHPREVSLRPRSSQPACDSPTPEEYRHELKHHKLTPSEKTLLKETKSCLQSDLRPSLDRHGGGAINPDEMQQTMGVFAQLIYQRQLDPNTQVEWKSDESKRSASLVTLDPLTSAREDDGGQSRGDKILSAALLRTLTPVVMQHFCMGRCEERRHQEAWQEGALDETVGELERYAVKKANKHGLFNAKIVR